LFFLRRIPLPASPEVIVNFQTLSFFCIAMLLLLLPDTSCHAQYDWHRQDADLPAWWPIKALRSVHLVSEDHGVVVGDMGAILRTVDGGGKWTTQSTELHFGLNAVTFVDNKTGFAVGDGGMILRSDDGGATWRDLFFRPAVDFIDVSFSDANTGIALGGWDRVFRTSDGGEQWTPMHMPQEVQAHYQGFYMFDALNAVFVGHGRSIHSTTDGGASWFVSGGECGPTYNAVTFVDRLNGYIIGNSGIILRTTNGGVTWDEQSSGTGMPLYGVSFTDALHGTVVGRGGIILRTTDGGLRWERSTSGVIENLYSVSFTDRNIGTVVGDNATILRSTTGGTTWVRDAQAANPTDTRRQNYPNPFTVSTNIPFHLERADRVSLRIIDAYGRDIATLYDGMMDAGMHTLTWQPRGLPAGMYFALFCGGTTMERTKLLLIDMK
jgi:photosystem II stability/assembly factor-like uncharacterized protein